MNYNRNSFGKRKIGKLKVNYYSISYDATTFVIVFDGIKFRFDAGTHIHMDGIDAVFITHTHQDHVRDIHSGILPSRDGKKRTVYVPKGTEKVLCDYVRSFLKLNRFRLPEKESEEESEGESEESKKIDGILMTEVEPEMEFQFTIKKKKLSMKVFRCYHGEGVPCVGYGFYEYKKKLKDEYKGLPGKRIGELRKSGVEISEEKKIPLFLFCGDTSVEFFEKNDSEEIFQFPIIFIECTRFDSQMTEEQMNSFHHIHWKLLEKYVTSHPKITFCLHHFSTRYFYGWERTEAEREKKKKEVIGFFSENKNVIPLV